MSAVMVRSMKKTGPRYPRRKPGRKLIGFYATTEEQAILDQVRRETALAYADILRLALRNAYPAKFEAAMAASQGK
jgi:hypothetical protein